MNYLSILTSLRGIAALFVVMLHSDLMLSAFLPPNGIVRLSWLWVDFFFILSGFIMMYVYGNNFIYTVDRHLYKKYIITRFSRVYPLNLFTLIITMILSICIQLASNGLDVYFQFMLNLSAAPASALFLQGMHLFSVVPLNTSSWSLSTEWWTYMIFPFFVPYFSKLNNIGMRILILLILVGYFFLMYYVGPLSVLTIAGKFEKGISTINITSDFGFFRCLIGFSLGMLIYKFYKAQSGYFILKKDMVFVFLFTFVFVAMYFNAHELFIVSLFALIILSAAYNCGHVRNVCRFGLFQYLGDLSFSIYMVHIPIIYGFWLFGVLKNPTLLSDISVLLNKPSNYEYGIMILCVLLLFTLTFATLVHHFIEVPAKNYILCKVTHKEIT